MDAAKLKERLAEYERSAEEYHELYLLNKGAGIAIQQLLDELEEGKADAGEVDQGLPGA